MKYVLLVAIPYVFVLTLAMMSGWDVPPPASAQQGFRGTGMVQVDNPRMAAAVASAESNQPPESYGPAEAFGDPAGELYENVQVLGDLTDGEFIAFMNSVTDWVAPEEGCAYCHNLDNLASDEVYTKVVARRMMQMTRTINSEWTDHVAQTGVNCYTCHRGQHVPQYAWVADDHHPEAGGFAASRNNQNLGVAANGFSSLPYDAQDDLLANDTDAVRIQTGTALPVAVGAGRSIQDTEQTYALMFTISQGLGVNCTYCHNTRSFGSWEQSPAARVTAWHGIKMAQSINGTYLGPLKWALPDHRLGPKGDAPKAACATCHQGQAKPMNGAPMLTDHPRALGVQ
jgi:photosynthetic reaction center cytochrome c subunit